MTSVLDTALLLASKGFHVYPTSRNSKIPPSGTHAWNDATTDTATIKNWFTNNPYNVAVGLKPSNLLLFDIDRGHKGGVDGVHNVNVLAKPYGGMTNDTLIERTPRGGLHYLFKVPSGFEFTKKENAFKEKFGTSGIDLLNDGMVTAPSVIDGVEYTRLYGSFDDIKPAPRWVLNYLKPSQTNNNYSGVIHGKKYTGRLIDKLMQGADAGSRNSYLTSIAGSMLAVGTEPENAYTLLMLINDNRLTPPLPTKEVATIFKSVLSREIRRMEVM